MTTLHLPHASPWLSRRTLVLCILALTFALCATPGSALEAQERTPSVTAATDLAAAPRAQLDPTQLAEARREGKALGAQQGGWFGRAFAVGFLTAYIGPVVMVPVAALSDPKPAVDARQRLAAKGPEYQAAFEREYRNQVRRKRVSTSAVGSTLGMAAIVGIGFAVFY